MKKVLACAASLSVMFAATGVAYSAGFEIIAPHRAVYEVKLIKASDRTGIKSMNGRMVYEIRGNECDGISLRYRFLTNISTAREQISTDQHASSFESPDGLSFDFHNKLFTDEQLENTVKGKARQSADGLSVILQSPEPRRLEFTKASFLTSHLVKIINLAKAGGQFLQGDIYDGSEAGDEIVGSSSFISGVKSVLDSKDGLSEDIIDQLKGTKAWPISMSYFEKTKDNSGEKLPIFESSFLLYENGISSDLLLRYPEYTLSAKLSELELFEKPACKSKG